MFIMLVKSIAEVKETISYPKKYNIASNRGANFIGQMDQKNGRKKNSANQTSICD